MSDIVSVEGLPILYGVGRKDQIMSSSGRLLTNPEPAGSNPQPNEMER